MPVTDHVTHICRVRVGRRCHHGRDEGHEGQDLHDDQGNHTFIAKFVPANKKFATGSKDKSAGVIY